MTLFVISTERADEGIIVNSYEDLVRKHVVRFGLTSSIAEHKYH